MTHPGAPDRTDLLGLDRAGLAALCREWGEKPFRGQQLMRWVHRRFESDFGAMSDLAKGFRETLQARARIEAPRVLSDHVAADGTRKWLLDVGQGNAIETVFIRRRRAARCACPLRPAARSTACSARRASRGSRAT
jgi:adenine C2-methylase RlmN of 23S rRNA A2503 and tRNA A37